MKKSKLSKNTSGLMDRWYESVHDSLREKTRIGYKGILENHAKPYFKELEIGKINESIIKQFLEQLESKGLSGGTSTLILSVLKTFFNYAVAIKVVAVNPASQVKIKKQPSK